MLWGKSTKHLLRSYSIAQSGTDVATAGNKLGCGWTSLFQCHETHVLQLCSIFDASVGGVQVNDFLPCELQHLRAEAPALGKAEDNTNKQAPHGRLARTRRSTTDPTSLRCP